MDKLSKDELISFAVLLDMPELLNFCSSSKYFNETICKNTAFWLHKLRPYGKISYYTLISDKTVREAVRFIMKNKYFDILKSLLRTKINKNDALIFASREGYLDAIKFLIEKYGVDIRNTQREALTAAESRKHLEVAQYLKEKGGDKPLIAGRSSKFDFHY